MIHFDGWTKLYDYWCSWDDPDIYPCGFFTYMIQAKKVPHREMKQLDPPKGMDRYNFSWEDYLNSVPARAVPFEFFDTVFTLNFLIWISQLLSGYFEEKTRRNDHRAL